MINYEKFIDIYTTNYFDNFIPKAEPTIEAFTEFYGEKYRKKITKDINNVNIYLFAPSSIDKIINEIIPISMFNEVLNNTYALLSILKIPNLKEITYGTKSDIITENNRLKIVDANISEVYNTNDEIMDDVLEYIFGKDKVFSFNYNNNFIYNFFKYDKAKQTEILRKIFNTEVLTEEIYNRIKEAIQYMDDLKKETHGNKKYIEAKLLYDYYKLFDGGPNEEFLFASNSPIEPRFAEHLSNDPVTMILPGYKGIALPAFIMDDRMFIHEMNHVVTSFIVKTFKNKYFIEKTGFDYINTYNTRNKPHSKYHPELILGEIINDRSAQDITDIIHSKGVYIYDKAHTYDLNLLEPYKELIPLIENFYQQFKELIKEARISSNANILFKYIDRDNFEIFKNFIGETYNNVFNKDEELTDNHIDQANELTKKLKR